MIRSMRAGTKVSLLDLREALEASWSADTAYRGVFEEGNPALGNCYPTARVIQYFYPEAEIVEGMVWTGISLEKHFWNVLLKDGSEYHIDLSWRQFPNSSSIRGYKVLDRRALSDGKDSTRRVKLLISRVKKYLQK